MGMKGKTCVSILVKQPKGTFYASVTRRYSQHKESQIEQFSARYGAKWLVYGTVFANLQAANLGKGH
jgi:predicted GIY-YIG superfamily endonuclease